ncbi:unnamed protein product [Ambrosiozyma monospora]|uniref:Unnamed protein product n=1 Tax=Ambrosiozyma monospora TaxID=43982 RepID=A0A9W7DGS6_AMBMO|nr:unnamed protein product [Ambrosiozyma monospora]
MLFILHFSSLDFLTLDSSQSHSKPSYAFQNGTNGWFEVDVPAILAPFVVDVTANNFKFNRDSWYIDVDFTSTNVGNYNAQGMYTTGEYSYDGSQGTYTVQVGFGVSVSCNLKNTILELVLVYVPWNRTSQSVRIPCDEDTFSL